jgi:hypothetical protein
LRGFFKESKLAFSEFSLLIWQLTETTAMHVLRQMPSSPGCLCLGCNAVQWINK